MSRLTLAKATSSWKVRLEPPRPPHECEKIIVYVILTLITVVLTAATAIGTFAGVKAAVGTLGDLGISPSWPPVFATLQSAAVLGLLLGLFGVPLIGIAAAGGLVVFFIGAVVVHLRMRAYRSLPSPLVFLALATATLIATVLR